MCHLSVGVEISVQPAVPSEQDDIYELNKCNLRHLGGETEGNADINCDT